METKGTPKHTFAEGVIVNDKIYSIYQWKRNYDAYAGYDYIIPYTSPSGVRNEAHWCGEPPTIADVRKAVIKKIKFLENL